MTCAYNVFLLAINWIIVALFVSPAWSEGKRIAFVWGIDRYNSIRSLENAENDARGIAAVLELQGFSVVAPEGTDRASFWRSWDSFTRLIESKDTIVFYFAGHGVQINQENYLLPSDAPGDSAGEHELRSRSISLSELFNSLDEREGKKPRIRIFILDACRQNPYKGRSRSFGIRQGLAKPPIARGSFVMYSADANQAALDKLGENDQDPHSLYTRHLIPMLSRPGLDLIDIAKRVQRQVHTEAEKVNWEQTPAYYDSIVGSYCLSGCDASKSDRASALRFFGEVADDIRLHYFPTPDRYTLLMSAVDALARKYKLPSLSEESAERLEKLQQSTSAEDFYVAMRQFDNLFDRALSSDRIASARDVAIAAVYGLYGGLDEESIFVDPLRYGSAALSHPGATGIEFIQESGRLKITNLVVDGPADRAGLKADDAITHIDNFSVAGLSEADIVARLRGPGESTVKLTIRRPGVAAPAQMEVKRSTALPLDFEWRELVDHNAVYIRVRRFGYYFAAQTAALSGVIAGKNVIIDLRGCEGGDFAAAREFIGFFAASSITVGIKAEKPVAGPFTLGPSLYAQMKSTSILIDKKTRGTAELAAFALKEASKAKLWGAKTYGKGTVQRITNYHYGWARLTAGVLVINDTRTFNRVGVSPDVEIPSTGGEDALKAVLRTL